MKWLKNLLRRLRESFAGEQAEKPLASVEAGRSTTARTRGDNPIRGVTEDSIGRAAAARIFAENVLAFDVSEGVVVGVLGPWGSGKTSFISLARPHLKGLGATILDFNPWMFGGAAQLVDSFFRELSAQLKVRPDLSEVGKGFEDYGEIFSGTGWIPVVGPWLERGKLLLRGTGAVLKRKKGGVEARRTTVAKALAALQSPLVVILDDIDRLTTSEIRDIFRLVRLTASFPNVIYVVAFDRARVETALAEEGIPGRDYLEKILQVAVDLPSIPAEVLNREVFRAIDEAISEVISPGRFDEDVWPDVYVEVIRPLIRNLRDVRRLASAVRGTASELAGQVALVDVLALEAIRVFLPDVFQLLSTSVDGLTATSDETYREHGAALTLKAQVQLLVDSAKDKKRVAEALIRRLFPAAQRHFGASSYGRDWKSQWLRDRRVAHEDVLRLYLERVAGEGLQTFSESEKAFALMKDGRGLDDYLRSLDVGHLEDVIAALENFADQFANEQVVPGCTVLLNLLSELPERPRGMFEFGKKLVVTRVVLRLLQRLEEPAAIERAVRAIFPELESLSSKLELISMIGYHENAGHKLVPENVAAELERAWRAEVRAASADALTNEDELMWVLLFARRGVGADEPPVEVPDVPGVTLGVLRSGRSDQLSQSSGSRAVRRNPVLPWDALIELYSDEGTLRARIESLRVAAPEGADELLQLAAKYLEGWRPGLRDG